MPGIHEGFSVGKPRRERIVYILAPKPGQPLQGVLLGNSVHHAEVHFDASLGKRGKTLPCLGMPLCSYCQAGIGSLEKHYLACCHPHDLSIFVMQLSEGAADDVKTLLEKVGVWRGLILHSTRAHKSKTARQYVESRGRFEGGPIPALFAIPPILERAWTLTPNAKTDTRTRTPKPTRHTTNGRN